MPITRNNSGKGPISWVIVLGAPSAFMALVLLFFPGRLNLYFATGLWVVAAILVVMDKPVLAADGKPELRKKESLLLIAGCILMTFWRIYRLK